MRRMIALCLGLLVFTQAQAAQPGTERIGAIQSPSVNAKHGFYKEWAMSLVPVMVCQPETVPNGKKCRLVSSGEDFQPVTPEAYLEMACPGAVFTSLRLYDEATEGGVAIGFDLPDKGCPPVPE